MKVPKSFIPKKDLEGKTEELLKEAPEFYKLKVAKGISKLKLKIVKDGYEIFVTYFIEKHSARITLYQPNISEQSMLNEMIVFAIELCKYHNDGVKIRAHSEKRNGKLEGKCSIPLNYQPNAVSLQKAIKDFYKNVVDELEILEAEHKQ